MTDKDRLVVHVAAFSSVADAEQALATIEQLYKDEAVGTLDAAVIDKEKTGRASVSSLSGSGAGLCLARSCVRRLSNSRLTRQGSSW